MANRENFPPTLFPLTGDVSGAAGAQRVTVVGIQTVPVSSTLPTDQQVLKYFASSNQYIPSSGGGTVTVFVNNVGVSDDFDAGVNGVADVEELVTAFYVNTTPPFIPNVSIQINTFPISDDWEVSVNAVKQLQINGA